MKILITGGAGFIGSHVAEAYLGEGHDVSIVDDLSTGSEINLPKKSRFYRQDICSPMFDAILQKERPDIVSHHAAQISVGKSMKNPFQDASINIMGTLNVLEACRKNGVKKIIFASSGGAIYGIQRDYPADESHITAPLSPYGIGKLAVEQYLGHYFRTHKISFVSLRYANVYGPRQNSAGEAGVIASFIGQIIQGKIPTIYGDGSHTRDYVFVEEIVHSNREALRDDVQGVFNVGTGIETDVNSIAAKIADLLAFKSSFRHGPPKEGEQKRSCLKPGRLQHRDRSFRLDEGLQRTISWFLKGHNT